MKPADTQSKAVALRPAIAREHRDFLPAAIEILEMPASPAGRAVAATIILFAVIALGWASFGWIDIITTAQGKVVPTERTKLIQPYETGVVRAIHVEDGQSVKAGQVLIELDPTINTAERDKNLKDLIAVKLDIARLQAALAGADDASVELVPPEGALPAQLVMHRTFMLNQLEEFHAKLANFDRQIVQNESNRRAIQVSIARLEATIPLLRERANARQFLSERGEAPRLTYLQDRQDLIEHEHELQVQQARLSEAEAAIAALREQRRQANAEFRRTNFTDLTQAAQKAASLQETLTQSEERKKLQTLIAPVDGTVQQLTIHTVGGVVTPAQQLMVLVPADSILEIEAMVPNRDIGFVQPGQEAEIKIDTFNFTRYGFVTGKVLDVSQDAVVKEKPQDARGADNSRSLGGSLSDTSEPKGQELVYVAHIALGRTTMQVEGRMVSLSPGMAVTAEIKTGQRRVIEYLLSPLLRYKQESLRER